MTELPRLVSTADYLTAKVYRAWDVVRAEAADTGQVRPTATYTVKGADYAFPLSYTTYIDLGRQMARTPSLCVSYFDKMGIELALLARQMGKAVLDAEHRGVLADVNFFREVEGVLSKIKPTCIVFSTLVTVIRARGYVPTDSFRGVRALGPEAVYVAGRNPVRTFVVVRPFARDPLGNIHFGEAEVTDSLRGRDPGGYFAGTYLPNRN